MRRLNAGCMLVYASPPLALLSFFISIYVCFFLLPSPSSNKSGDFVIGAVPSVLLSKKQMSRHHHQRTYSASSNSTSTTNVNAWNSSFADNNSNALYYGVHARAFDSWSHGEIPCFPPRLSRRAWRQHGLLYLKPLKAGSSTAAGINVRILHNQARRRTQRTFSTCDGVYWHAHAYKTWPQRHRNTSFAWSILREPTRRLVSSFFYFKVSAFNVTPTDEGFIQYFRGDSDHCNHYLQRLSTKVFRPPESTTTHANDAAATIAAAVANQIMTDYDFIGVTERMDESAVVLSMLLHIPLGDVLFLNTKTSGQFGQGGQRCFFLQPSVVSPGMRDFFATPEFQDCIHWDALLHAAANRSLDLTIDRLGREKVERLVTKFRAARVIADQRCIPTTVFSCIKEGPKNPENDCLWEDLACGHECLDQVATDLNLWQVPID